MKRYLVLACLFVPWLVHAQNYSVLDSSAIASNQANVAIGLGQVPGYARIALIGHASGIANGAAADVWEGGGLYPFQTFTQALEVVSTSANDTAAGTGARTVGISCLDGSYNQLATQVVALNGTTAVAVPQKCLRVNQFLTLTAGSDATNDGDVTLRLAGAGVSQSVMKAGTGFALSAVYTVPNGSTLYVSDIVFSVIANGSTSSATFGIWTQTNGVQRTPAQFQITSVAPYHHIGYYGIAEAAKTDLVIRELTNGQNNTTVTVVGEGVLVANGQTRK